MTDKLFMTKLSDILLLGFLNYEESFKTLSYPYVVTTKKLFSTMLVLMGDDGTGVVVFIFYEISSQI